MSETLWRRFIVIIAILLAMFIVLAVGLGQVTLNPSEEIIAQEDSVRTNTQVLRGARGKILSSKGEPIAYNEQSYNIEFWREDADKKDESWRPYYTQVFMKAIDVIESNGGKTIDTFNIERNEETGEFAFNWGNLGIEDEVLALEAAKKRETNWRTNMQVRDSQSYTNTPEEIYEELRTRFYIPEELDYTQARKLLSIWQEIQLNAAQITPVTIASNVSKEVVAELESRSTELDSISSSETTHRVYPKGELLGNVIGYTSRITSEDNYSPAQDSAPIINLIQNNKALQETDTSNSTLREMGYAVSDKIGRMGLENSMEQYLTGSTTEHHGSIVTEVTQRRNISRRLSEQAPTDGYDVYTTLDLGLQEVTMTALEENIATTREAQMTQLLENYEYYQDKKSDPLDAENGIRMAEQGVAVVIEVDTGRVLAMANYPNIDNNMFVSGISETDWKAMNDLNEQKGISVLRNNAAALMLAPGSIIKPAIGLAGLEEGVITRTEEIDDEGPYAGHVDATTGQPEIRTNQPHCWAYPNGGYQTHTHQTVDQALRVSCNYFFFEVANRLSISKVDDWLGTRLGLAQPSGIELPSTEENIGQVGGQNILYDSSVSYERPPQKTYLPVQVHNNLLKMIKGYMIEVRSLAPNDEEEERRDEQANRAATRMMELVNSDTIEIGQQIRDILSEECGIPNDLSASRGWSQQISDQLYQIRWNVSYTVRTGIGQSIMQTTPIAIARYIAAIANGGTLYEAHLIDRVVDQSGTTILEKAPVVEQQLDADPQNLAIIKAGMGEVVSLEDGGTAGKAFDGFKYKGQFGGKTGTAQISEQRNIIDLENTAWMVAFAPLEKPEIAIVVCMPNAWAGVQCAPTVKSIIQYWMDRENEKVEETLYQPNEILR